MTNKESESNELFTEIKPEILRLLSSHPQYGSIGFEIHFQKGNRSRTEFFLKVSELPCDQS